MEIKTHKIQNSHLPSDMAGWGNGYIGLPKDHPWFAKDYDDIPCNVHGGLTYGANHKPLEAPDGLWWIGFDTAHWSDNQFEQNEAYVDGQIQSMVDQANKVVTDLAT